METLASTSRIAYSFGSRCADPGVSSRPTAGSTCVVSAPARGSDSVGAGSRSGLRGSGSASVRGPVAASSPLPRQQLVDELGPVVVDRVTVDRSGLVDRLVRGDDGRRGLGGHPGEAEGAAHHAEQQAEEEAAEVHPDQGVDRGDGGDDGVEETLLRAEPHQHPAGEQDDRDQPGQEAGRPHLEGQATEAHLRGAEDLQAGQRGEEPTPERTRPPPAAETAPRLAEPAGPACCVSAVVTCSSWRC